MDSLSFWFSKEVSRWRTWAVVVWSLAIVMLLSVIYMLLVNFSVFDPFSSAFLTACALQFCTRQYQQTVGFLCISLLIEASTTTVLLSVVCDVPRTRLMKLYWYIRPRQLLVVGVHLTTTVAVTLCLLNLTNEQLYTVSYPCPADPLVRCMNEKYLYVVVSSVFLACTRLPKLLSYHYYELHFSPVVQPCFLEVKSRFGALLNRCCRHARTYVLYYVVLYFLVIGAVTKNFVRRNLQLGEDSDVVTVDSLYGLLNVSLVFCTWLTAVFVDVMLSLPYMLTTVYQTQAYTFPVEAVTDNQRGRCLHNAIGCNSDDMLQSLACFDFGRLTRYSHSRRQQIFGLTTLSAQPVNWTSLSTVCIAQLRSFTDVVNTTNNVIMSRGATTNIHVMDEDMKSTNIAAGDHTFGRIMSLPATSNVNIMLAKVSQHPVVTYFTTESVEATSSQLFACTEKLIHIVDGLSHLVAMSFHEDIYGVVQTSLPVILTTYFDLLEACERHIKLCPFVMRRPHTLTMQSAEYGQHAGVIPCATLKSAIKCALYRIVTTFHHHLGNVVLHSAEHSRRLQLFADHRD